jgi:hypothetical protein
LLGECDNFQALCDHQIVVGDARTELTAIETSNSVVSDVAKLIAEAADRLRLQIIDAKNICRKECALIQEKVMTIAFCV